MEGARKKKGEGKKEERGEKGKRRETEGWFGKVEVCRRMRRKMGKEEREREEEEEEARGE